MNKICVRRKRMYYFSLHTQLTTQLEPANVLGLSFLYKSMDICARVHTSSLADSHALGQKSTIIPLIAIGVSQTVPYGR